MKILNATKTEKYVTKDRKFKRSVIVQSFEPRCYLLLVLLHCWQNF